MSNNKRPRPAIPVLVHVDNQTEVDNTIVTKNVKSINETLGSPNDYSTNTSVVGLLKGIKENITGGGSGSGVDMSTVNTNTTKISNVLGDVSEESTSGTILGQLKQANKTLGTARSTTASEDLFGKISTIRNYTENNNGKLVDIKKTIGETGDVVSASTISGRLHSIAYVTGNQNDQASVNTISGKLEAVKNLLNNNYGNTDAIRSTVGKVSDDPAGTTISARLAAIKNATTSNYTIAYNLRDNIGFPNAEPTDNTVIGLLKGIKESGGSGGGADMTTVNTNTTAIKDTIGTSGDPQDTNTISGKLSALRGTNNTIALYSETIRNNLGVSSDSSSSNTVIGLLKRIIENN